MLTTEVPSACFTGEVKEQVAPSGRPEQLNCRDSLKPFMGVISRATSAPFPNAVLTLPGLAVIVKSGPEILTVIAAEVEGAKVLLPEYWALIASFPEGREEVRR